MEMWINHKLVDFSNAAKMNGVAPGRGAEDEEADEANNKNTDVADTLQVDNADQVVPQQHVVHEHSGMCPRPSRLCRLFFLSLILPLRF